MNVVELLKNHKIFSDPGDEILKKTNDYTIYSHFIGRPIKMGEMISSPLRVDPNPTFCLFYPTRTRPQWDDQILFKDFNGESGNVFQFVKKYAIYHEGILLGSKDEICQYIRERVFGGKVYDSPVKEDYTSNTYYISSAKKLGQKHFEYWDEHGVSRTILDIYSVRQCNFLLDEENKIVRNFKGTITFAYIIGDRFKLYQPNEENFVKFFNQCSPEYLQGYQQCRYTNLTLLVTKALKDILVYQAHSKVWTDMVAPHGEGYNWVDNVLDWMLFYYRDIIIIFDFDHTGVKGANKLRKLLVRRPAFRADYHRIHVHFVSTRRVLKKGRYKVAVKDIADFRLLFGEEPTRLLTNQLLLQ